MECMEFVFIFSVVANNVLIWGLTCESIDPFLIAALRQKIVLNFISSCGLEVMSNMLMWQCAKNHYFKSHKSWRSKFRWSVNKSKKRISQIEKHYSLANNIIKFVSFANIFGNIVLHTLSVLRCSAHTSMHEYDHIVFVNAIEIWMRRWYNNEVH